MVERSDTSDNTVDILESSANRDMSVFMSKLESGKSLMYMMNIKGPVHESCGTPDATLA